MTKEARMSEWPKEEPVRALGIRSFLRHSSFVLIFGMRESEHAGTYGDAMRTRSVGVRGGPLKSASGRRMIPSGRRSGCDLRAESKDRVPWPPDSIGFWR